MVEGQLKSLNVMTPKDDLITWNEHWTVEKGVVTCRACHVQQKEAVPAPSFQHLDGCLSSQHINPWNDLISICRRLSHHSG